MIDDPIRSAFEHIDEDASHEFRAALHARLLAELVGHDTTDHDESDAVVSLTSSDAEPTSGRRWPILIAAAAVVLFVGALVLVTRDDASEPEVPAGPPVELSRGSGLIALAGSGESGHADIYAVAPDGSGLRALTSTPGVSEVAPAWSPDGTRLAFLRNLRFGGGELVVIDPATGDETFSADIHAAELDPGPPGGLTREVDLPWWWSPDGRLIALNLHNCGSAEWGHGCFVMVDLETGTWTTIIGGGAQGWSPDGKWFAFRSGDEGRPGLFLVPADLLGTTDLVDVPNLPGVRLLAESVGFVAPAVSWMPDSSAVAIVTARGSIDVVTIADGRRRTLIEDGGVPSWSPDGSHLAYMRGGEGRNSVWVADADGTGAREVVAMSYVAPTWSPGGRLLTVVGADGVFTVRPDGTGMTPLALVRGTWFTSWSCPDLECSPVVWQPGATEAATTDATETTTTEASATSDG